MICHVTNGLLKCNALIFKCATNLANSKLYMTIFPFDWLWK